MNEEVINQDAAQPAPPDFLDIIKDKPGAPDREQIDKWKAKFGAVYVSGFSEEEVYVWRPITRHEYKQIQLRNQEIASLQDPKMAVEAQMTSEEEIVSMCLCWPKKSAEDLANDKGGTVPSLLEQIMQNSNFLTPQQASFLVVKL